MSSRPFVHLHCHSHYSLLDGASKVPALVARAKELGMPALALTDHGNLYGAFEFLREANAIGLQPIVGLEAYVAPGKRTERSGGGTTGQEYAFHLTLLARNAAGFRNLVRLSSLAYLEGFYYKARIDKELLETYSEGLVCLSGCASSELSDLILHGKTPEAERLCAWYLKVFGPENFFVEIQDNGIAIQKECMVGALDIANRMGLPLVATSDAHYLTREDAAAHDVLLCINTKKTLDDPKRLKFETEEYYLRSPDEMYAAMPGQADALATSLRIAERVDYDDLELGKRCFPAFQPPEDKTPEDYLRQLCLKGLNERYGEDPPEAAVERLELELGVINRMEFASYFLIVWDFVRFAREKGIPSSARGSACGALVSYLLYLSHVDPLKYDLLFERFLDPNRSEAPDIDIDLCQDRRYEVIEYVRGKYGAANVAQIGTFGTMAARASIKDVGRALNIPLSRVEQVAKLVPRTLHITLEEAITQEPELRKLGEQDPEIKKLLDYAKRLEGLARSAGTHAAGVVIADRPLHDLVPLQKLAGKDSDVVTTQWNMGDVEKAGLLKMDFLGLRNLTILERAVKLINERHPDTPLDLNTLPLDDQETYQLLQRGETKGVFQLESPGIRDLLMKMKPDLFNDIIATNALYRPGPLGGGMVDAYVKRKHKEEVPHYPHPEMREILEETHGVMVYQEQVMRILNRLGGIDLSQAYACIKAISKKKTEVIAQGRAQFIAGATEQGLSKETATEIFDLIEFFGGYGFNKSHSTAYALVAFQTAYLKAHYPTEFMAALLSSELDGAERDKLVEHIDECRRMGIEVLMPDINQGHANFQVAAEGKIHFGLAGIKGVGVKAVEAIVAAREERGPFKSLDDFFERVAIGIVNQASVETLIKAGAFDGFGARRSQLLAVLPKATQAGQSYQDDRKRGQRSLFDSFGSADEGPQAGSLSLPDVPELPDNVLLAEEKKALGFYMSSHPLTRHAVLLRALGTHQVADLAAVPDKGEVILGGMIAGVQLRNVQKSRSGLTRMAKLTFEDLTGSIPAMLWPEDFAKNEEVVKDDLIGFVRGTLDRRRDQPELVINRVIPIDRAPAELSRGLVIRLLKGVHQTPDLERLLRLVRVRNGGNLDVFLEILGVGRVRRAIYKAGASLKVRYDDHLVADIEGVVGLGNVRLLGQRGATTHIQPPVVPTPTETELDEAAENDTDNL
ncbi:MAG TPA: DNA polymerase III subunit alpha [Isosphaeraceae bacterium]|jgi:DNA polymerase-3 subunit alpha|nr:DNA polymerase III subunit alpha [Isosphaeraceae bacterium]